MTCLYRLIGEKLGHTYSPRIHAEILKEINVEGEYSVFEVKRENLKDVIKSAKDSDVKGLSVTIPYKTDIIQYLDHVSDEVKKIGAVNVVDIDNSKRAVGYNTDYYGFGMMLERYDVSVAKQNALVLGTGGVSNAVIQYLKDSGAYNITIATRDIEAAHKKYKDYDIVTYDSIKDVKNCYVVINCTPVGMYPKVEHSPIDKKVFNNFKMAVDLIYNPQETLFLKDAKEYGLKTVNGLYMLVAQAVKSQEIWNDVSIDKTAIDRISNIIESNM